MKGQHDAVRRRYLVYREMCAFYIDTQASWLTETLKVTKQCKHF